MADFTAVSGLLLALNTGTTPATPGTPVWTTIALSGGAAELRFSDQANQGATASASWPYMTRPGTVQHVPYQYAFSADTTSLGYLGTTSNTPIAWAASNYMDMRIQWDVAGTFASAPILTAYYTTAHAAVSRGDNDVLGGNTTDTGGTARSYLKGNMYGIGATVQAAAATIPAIAATDGSTGSVSPATGAWLTASQGLMGDVDYITYGSVPTAVTAQNLNISIDLWTGPNMVTGTKTPVLSTKYTYA